MALNILFLFNKFIFTLRNKQVNFKIKKYLYVLSVLNSFFDKINIKEKCNRMNYSNNHNINLLTINLPKIWIYTTEFISVVLFIFCIETMMGAK